MRLRREFQPLAQRGDKQKILCRRPLPCARRLRAHGRTSTLYCLLAGGPGPGRSARAAGDARRCVIRGSTRMALERTLSIVKPDGVRRNLIGDVYRRFEQSRRRIIAARMLHLTATEAEGFYAVHRERPFFKDLVRYMSSGPVIVQVLEGESAIARNRDIMGATDPKKAAPGTIRADLATSIEQNVVHGSDAPDTAAGQKIGRASCRKECRSRR